MNFDEIINKIFNKKCNIKKNTTNKYINDDNIELYKVECNGYIKKSDINNLELLNKKTELILVDKIYIL